MLEMENPRWKVETQSANTISEDVSEKTVAPYVTVMGSSFSKPNRWTRYDASNVCEASSDPITIAGTRL